MSAPKPNRDACEAAIGGEHTTVGSNEGSYATIEAYKGIGKRWVQAKENIYFPDSFPRHHGKIWVPKGSVGFIREENGNVQFAMTVADFPEELLEDAPLPTVEEALEIIESFQGHHCDMRWGHSNKFQFSIKVHAWPPDSVQDVVPEAEWYGELDHLLSDTLEDYMDNPDCGLKADFDWIYDWHTAGRSGGWLVLDGDISVRDYAEEIEEFKHDLEEWENEVIITEIEELLGDVDEGEIGRLLFEIEELKEGIAERGKTIIDLALDLQLIDAKIKKSVKELEEYIESEEPWEALMEKYKGNEEEEEVECVCH